MEFSTQHLSGLIITLVLVVAVGVRSGRRVSNSRDFSVTGRQAGCTLVAGTIMGTLVGGASTIGTAQLAYLHGFSAWWFTLGGGIACFLLGLLFAKPLRRRNLDTVTGLLQEEYGRGAGTAAVLFVSAGIFLNIVPQVMSSAALLQTMLPVSLQTASLVTVLLMAGYVMSGGVWGAGLIGIVKITLTCLSLLVSGAVAMQLLGGPAGLAVFPRYPWLSLFGRGLGEDLAAALSLLVGVLSSQIYFQAVLSARDLKTARRGAFISALVTPLIGLAGIMVGLFMRANHPDIIAAQALPLFILGYLSPWFAGIVQATLLLAAIGTGAGLSLGVSTMLCRDIYQQLCPNSTDQRVLALFRVFIAAILGLVFIVILAGNGSGVILKWSYLSLGLRGATIFFPLLSALFLKGRVQPKAGLLAIITGPAIVILWALLWRQGPNPFYAGLLTSLIIVTAGFLAHRPSLSVGGSVGGTEV